MQSLIKIVLLLVVAFCNNLLIQELNSNLNETNILDELMQYYLNYLLEYIDPELISKSPMQCQALINNYRNNNFDYLHHIFINSGKTINDLGQKSFCLENKNLNYYLLKVKVNSMFSKNDQLNQIIYYFNNQKSFFFGFCLPKVCGKLYFEIVDHPSQKLDEFLKSYGLVKIKLSSNKVQFNHERERDYCPNILLGILFFTLILFMLELIVSFFGLYYFKMNSEIRSNLKSSIELSDSIESHVHFNFHDLSVKSKTASNSHFANIFGKIYKFISLRRNIKTLYKVNSKIYNETNLEKLGGIRFLILYFIIFRQNFDVLSKIPSRFLASKDFYGHYSFSFVKLSEMSVMAYITLSAFSFAFKLFSYLKTTEIKFICFIKFNLLFISKYFLFYFIFFIFYRNIFTLAKLFKLEQLMDYIIEIELDNKKCFKQYSLLFNPFLLPYSNDKYYSSCNMFVLLFSNEILVQIVISLFLYFCFKIKSKCYDNFMIILVFSSFIFFNINFNPEDRNYSLEQVFGETLSISYPHLLLMIYLVGFFCGTCYFYYTDIVKENPVSSQNYFPFRIAFRLMIILDQLKKPMKIFLLVLSIVLMTLICMGFNIFLSIHNDLPRKFTPFLRILFIYEKNIFTILFLFLILLLFISFKNEAFSRIFSSQFFLFISRLGFPMICISQSIIFLVYCSYDIQIQLNYLNLFIMSVFFTFTCILISLFLVIIFELPFRKFIKWLLRPKSKVEN